MKYVRRIFEYMESMWQILSNSLIKIFDCRLLKISLNVDVLNRCLFDAFTEGSIMHRINHVSTITLFTPNSKQGQVTSTCFSQSTPPSYHCYHLLYLIFDSVVVFMSLHSAYHLQQRVDQTQKTHLVHPNVQDAPQYKPRYITMAHKRNLLD